MEVSKGLVGWSHPRANAHAHALTFLILNTDLIYVWNLNPGREDYFFLRCNGSRFSKERKGVLRLAGSTIRHIVVSRIQGENHASGATRVAAC
jgi:hypothetical protein